MTDRRTQDPKNDLAAIEYFIDLAAKGAAPNLITLGYRGEEIIIIDGNKSTVAAYEYARNQNNNDLYLTVFLLSREFLIPI